MKKQKEVKIRTVWNFNPKSRIKESKKKYKRKPRNKNDERFW